MDLISLALSKKYTDKRIKETHAGDADLADYYDKKEVDALIQEIWNEINGINDELEDIINGGE